MNKSLPNEHLEQVKNVLLFLADRLDEEKISWFLGASGALVEGKFKIVGIGERLCFYKKAIGREQRNTFS